MLSSVVASDFANGFEPRALLEQTVKSEDNLRSSVITDQSWVPYPAYTDREAWDQFTGDSKRELIRQGEKYLNFPWKVVKASDYLEFERSGSRSIMEKPFGENCQALRALVVAELAEGKGRFLPQIANGTYFFCEMTSWVLSAHLKSQKSRRSLPDDRDQIIDLTSADVAALMAWTHYFLHNELDKIHPLFSDRIRREVRRRAIDPYMNQNFHWSGLNKPKGSFANNWNPWCNANMLQIILLMCDDKEEMVRGVYRTMLSVDRFIDYVKGDGACEEGPSYWTHAAGKLYDYLNILSMGTGGKINLLRHPLVRDMGEYIVYSSVGNGWVVNFADASARNWGDIPLIYSYGKACGSKAMTSFAVNQLHLTGDKLKTPSGRDMFRTLEWLETRSQLKAEAPIHHTEKRLVSWYPETQFCYFSNPNNGFFVAAKGGHNNESHNHNDVGTFSVYIDTVPFLIDIGVGTYTRQTFSSERYSIWTMQSDYHNVPVINGFSQQPGGKFHAQHVNFDTQTRTFSLDLSRAYPKEADLISWKRALTLSDKGLKLTDTFTFGAKPKEPNVYHYMSWVAPDLSQEGYIRLTHDKRTLTLSYNPKQLKADSETIELTDPVLKRTWGDKVYRISLISKELDQQGSCTITLQ